MNKEKNATPEQLKAVQEITDKYTKIFEKITDEMVAEMAVALGKSPDGKPMH